MIAPHELRLGNLVLAPGLWEEQYFTILELYGEECSVSPDRKDQARIVSYQELHPISVTLALLGDFGFGTAQTETEKATLHSHYILLEQGSHRLYLNAELQPVKSPAQPIALITHRLRYFHQLQNLFYSLTGQELSIFASQR